VTATWTWARSAIRRTPRGEHYYCDENCLSVYVPYCGDGNLDVGEECDPPNATPVNHYYCDENCLSVYVPSAVTATWTWARSAIRRTPRR